MTESLFGTDRVDHFGLRVEFDTESALIKIRHRGTELGDSPAGGIPVVPRVLGRFNQLVHRGGGRREIGVAEAEVDHIFTRSPCINLQRVNDREDIGRKLADPAELHDRPLLICAGSISASGVFVEPESFCESINERPPRRCYRGHRLWIFDNSFGSFDQPL